MVHFCCVPGCSNRSNRETELSYFGLPLKNKALLKVWMQKIWRDNLPLNNNTRIFSEHFVSASKRKLRPDEYPSLKLPQASHTTIFKLRKPPKQRTVPERSTETSSNEEDIPDEDDRINNIGTQANDGSKKLIEQLKETVKTLQANLSETKFCIENISKDDQDLNFYTGFTNYTSFKACYDFLGPAVNDLKYWGSQDKDAGHGRR